MSIHDALKKAQEERDRKRAAESGAPEQPAQRAPETPLAAALFQAERAAEEELEHATPPNPPESVVPEKPVTPVGVPMPPRPAERAREKPDLAAPLTAAVRADDLSPARQAADRTAATIVEDYESKQRLNLPPEIVVYHDRTGQVAEEFRRIRNALLADGRTGPRLVALTSAVAGEGKTTALLNLGLSLVELRSTRVVLVDADLARGTLSRHLQLGGKKGLSDLLTAGGSAEDLLCPTPWHHLFILPSGTAVTPQHATELLRRSTARTVLRQARNLADITLADTPAILATPDAGIIGAAADALVMVTRLNATPRAVVQRAARLLESLSVPLKGTILTHAKG